MMTPATTSAFTVTGLNKHIVASGTQSTTEIRDFRFWKDLVRTSFPSLEHRNLGSGDFYAKVSSYRLGSGALTTINADACEVIRTRYLADQSETGFIKLMWQMTGDLWLEQDNRQCVISAGQTTVCDTTRPYRIRLSEGAHFAVLMLPQTACPGWERISQKICGSRLEDVATMQAVRGALLALSEASGDGATEANETVLQAVHWMITTALHRSVSDLGISNLHNPRLNKAQQHILENIANPELDADGLAAALCMSRRSLYMLFKEYELTPGKMIHDLRLERCRQALADASQQNRKITDIAFDHGFSDYATFSRLFKTHFGLTPSEYRLKARAPH